MPMIPESENVSNFGYEINQKSLILIFISDLIKITSSGWSIELATFSYYHAKGNFFKCWDMVFSTSLCNCGLEHCCSDSFCYVFYLFCRMIAFSQF